MRKHHNNYHNKSLATARMGGRGVAKAENFQVEHLTSRRNRSPFPWTYHFTDVSWTITNE